MKIRVVDRVKCRAKTPRWEVLYIVPYLLELELAMFYLVLKLRWRSVLIPPFTSIGENIT